MADEGEGTHPLLISLVVYDVLRFLPAAEVESCRLVCKTWNREACTILRNKRIVVFLDPEPVIRYVNAMRNTIDFPHAHFEFCINDFTGFVDENLREFWTTFGPHIKALEFRQSYLFWRDFLDVVVPNVPNLEQIAFRHLPRNLLRRTDAATERRQVLSVTKLRLGTLPPTPADAVDRFTDLFKTFPNIQSLEFLEMNKDSIRAKVSAVLRDVLRKPEISLPNLRRFCNFRLQLSNELVDMLTKKSFFLESLQITLLDGVTPTAFRNLMMSLQPCLRNLSVTFPSSFAPDAKFAANHPGMRPEECVRLLYNVTTLQMYNFRGSIHFVANLPELETLEITTPNTVQIIPYGFTHNYRRGTENHQLKHLKLFPATPETEFDGMVMLISIFRCFPDLNTLHLHRVDDDGLGILYRNLPFLLDVELLMSSCTDQGLTGIPLQICHDMLETTTYVMAKPEKYRQDLFIGSLLYLRRFSVDSPQITNVSIALGLANCRNLKELKISSPQITDNGLIFIADDFGKQLTFLDVSSCPELTALSTFYAQAKLSGKLLVAPEALAAPGSLHQNEMATPNPNRGIININMARSLRAAGFTPDFRTRPSGASNSAYRREDTNFLEESRNPEADDRGIRLIDNPFDGPFHNPYIHDIGRNGDFVRSLTRMGHQRFRRLYEQALEDVFTPIARSDWAHNVAKVFYNSLPVKLIPSSANHPRDLDDAAEGSIEEDASSTSDEDDQQHLVPQNENDDGEVEIAHDAPEPPPPPSAPTEPELLDDVNGDDQEQPTARLPDVHIAELLRIGLHPEDIETFTIRNSLTF